MPRTKITTAEEREISSMLPAFMLDSEILPTVKAKHLKFISRHLDCPLWKVKVIAKREQVRIRE